MKKGFTLIELIGVVVVLAVIGFVVYPIISGLLVDNKEQIYERQIEQLEKIASNWVVTNSGQITFEDNETHYLYLSDLYEQGYIEENELYNPKTNEPLTGCITVTWQENINQHIYNYDPECNVVTPPGLVIRTNNGIINSNGWAKEDFVVYIEGQGLDKYTYCVSDKKCEPDTEVIAGTGNVSVNTEGTTYVCANGTNETGTTDTICKEYKLDKTKPVMGTIKIAGTLGLNDYYISNVEVSHTKSTDALSGIESEVFTPNAGLVDYDTDGKTYSLTATDKAGNTETITYVLKLDKTVPTVGTLNINGTKGTNDWYVSDVTFTVNNGSDETSGHLSTTSNISSITSNTNGTKVIVTTTDKAGNSDTRDYTVKVDKTLPTGSAVASSNSPYTMDVEVTAEDTYSGVLEYGYLLSETNSCPTTGYTMSSSSTHKFTSLTPEKDYYVCVKLVDKASNVNYIVSNQDKVENSIPVGPSIIAKLNSASGATYNQDWTNQNVHLTFSPNLSTDTVTRYEYKYDNGTYSTSGVTMSGKNGTMLVSNDKEGTLYVRACNNSGCGDASSVIIKVDQTDPEVGTIEFVGTTGLNDWYVSSVNVSHTESTDELSGIKTEELIPETNVIDSDTLGVTYILTATDKAGNSTSAQATIKVDLTKPEAGTIDIAGTLGHNGWYTSDVTFTINNGSDATSGHSSTTANMSNIKYNTNGTKVVVTTTDKAGNTNTRDYTVKVDKTAPTVGTFDIDGTLGSNGWYISDVTISGTGGSDDTSGPVTNSVDVSKITSNTNGTTITLTTTNQAGLTSTDTTTIKVDKTAPTGSVVATSTDPYTVDVTATIEDVNSGVKEYGYLLSETGSCPNTGYASSSSNTHRFNNLTPEKEYYVCVKVVDKASNTDYIASNKVKVENNIPVGPSIVAKLNNASGSTYNQDWTNQNVYLEFSPNLNTDTVTSYEYQYGSTTGTWSTSGVTMNGNNGTMLVSGDKEGTLYVRGCNQRGCGDANSVIIKIDQTAPEIGTIQFVGTTGLNDWYVSNVDVSYIASTDNLSGIKTETLSPSAGTINYDTKGITYTLTATDKAGNTASTSGTIKVDVTAPTVGTIAINGTKGTNDWYTSDVTFTVNNGSDATSGHLTTTSSLSSIKTNTDGTKVTVTTTDKAGNTATRDYNVKVDKTAPTVGTFDIVGTLGSNGWYTSNVTISGKGGSDDVSGPVTNTVDISSITSNTEGTTITLTTTNRAGLTSTDTVTIKVDKTAPTAGSFNIVGTLGSNGWYTSNVTISGTGGSDDVSGPVTNTVDISSITSNTEGTKVTLTTTNKAGLTSTDTTTIKVDKDKPVLTAKTGPFEITEGDSVDVKSYFNTPSYGISGEASYTCNITNTSNLEAGTHTINCTATSNNGLSTTAGINLTVKPAAANPPILFTNMIPVTYNTSTSKWKYANVNSTWYDYDSGMWANAVILKSGKSYSVGNDIAMDDIAQMYVWIPRYKYTIFNGNNSSVSEQLINVEFESGTNTTGTVKCYDAISGTAGTSSEVCSDSTNGSIKNGTSTYTHPAFCLGRKNTDGSCNGTELTGIWVGKFEVSGSASAANLTVLPNKNPLVSTSVSSFFTAMSGVSNSFNIKDTNNKLADSHMMKNMEWGAVAYLKQSKYGLGTTDIALNNYCDQSQTEYYMTGCGSEIGTTTFTETCAAYHTANGQAASTTGNIYGVYDMSGGTREYVMGNMVNESGEFYPSSAGTFSPAEKYYDIYTYNTSNATHGRGKLGDATKETLKTFGTAGGRGWYSDYTYFPSSTSSWFVRGGYAINGANAGVFNFNIYNGRGRYYDSARLVITEQ